MDEQPSRTAVWTAAARAAHLIVDSEPRIFEDTLAGLLLGDTAKELIGAHRDSVESQNLAHLRVAVTTRSRYTEHRLAEAVRRGIGQYVILGAGLDSFAYRSPFADQLRVFEVDHAATQAWKRERLGAASIGVPRWLTFVSVDFRIDSLRDRLLDMGFDTTQPAFVSWLGVAEYLTIDAIATTLDAISGLAHGTELVMEYLVPAELRDEPGHAVAEFFMSRAAQSGEPWLTFFTPAAIAEILAARGLIPDDDVGRRDQVEPSLWQRSDGLRPNELGRLVHAVVTS